MKKIIFLNILLFTGLSSLAQSLNPVTIIPQRSYYLNGGARATYGGGTSRETIKIDLPPNTKSCYYSFTTSPGQDGTQLLDLGLQIGTALYGGALFSSLAPSIKVPTGSGSADIFVIPVNSRDAFLNKQDGSWKMYKDISLQNSKQAVQYINNLYGKSFYIALRNPSALTGINISIEVVAIVETVNEEADKGVLYGNLGWSAYERGEYDKCIEWSNKALIYNPNLAYVRFNIALVYLAQEKEECIEHYINGITVCKKNQNTREYLNGALNDVRNLKLKKPHLKNLANVEQLLNAELNKN